MTSGGAVAFRDLTRPESTERSGQLVSSDSGWLQVELSDGGAPVPGGTLVELRTTQIIHLGQVEDAVTQGRAQTLRVRIDHTLSLQDVSSIQKVWTQEQRD